MTRILEFMGLPGSGKSTLSCALAGEARRRGLAVRPAAEAVLRCIRRRDDGMLRNFLKRLPYPVWEPVAGVRHALAELHAFASDHVALFALWFEVLDRGPVPEAWRRCILHAFFRRCAERQLLDAHLAPDEGALVDEGFALGVITMLGCLPPGTPCEADVERYVRHAPAPYAVFWIDPDPAACAARLRRRPAMPLLWEACTESELLAHLEYGRHCMGLAAREYERRGIPVCRVGNDDGVADEALRRICGTGIEWSERMLERSR